MMSLLYHYGSSLTHQVYREKLFYYQNHIMMKMVNMTGSDRISDNLKKRIEDAIPNRIKYFDEQKFNMYPIQ